MLDHASREGALRGWRYNEKVCVASPPKGLSSVPGRACVHPVRERSADGGCSLCGRRGRSDLLGPRRSRGLDLRGIGRVASRGDGTWKAPLKLAPGDARFLLRGSILTVRLCRGLRYAEVVRLGCTTGATPAEDRLRWLPRGGAPRPPASGVRRSGSRRRRACDVMPDRGCGRPGLGRHRRRGLPPLTGEART